MTATPPPSKPTWLAREAGMAHAFMPDGKRPGLKLRSVCGHVDRSMGQPFGDAASARVNCYSCVLRLREVSKLRAKERG